ncbi:MAG TPA: hypothetical protein VF787_15090 [Thermoanaerobaculia bacterium]
MFLGACSSGGGLGDILGGGNNTNYQLRGTVDSVDTGSRSIWLSNVSGYNGSMLSSGGSNNNNTVRVYYDDNTTVQWNGNAYRPQDLERGDQVSVTVDDQGSTLVADTVNVTYNAATGPSSGTTNPNDSYGTSIRGTVRYIDTSRGTIEVARSYGSNVIVEASSSTPVYYNNKTYRFGDLEVGDEIDIRYRDLGNGRVSAQDISVIRSNNGNTSGGSTSSNYATIRGTVRSINTSNRTIQLESTTWRSGFTGSNTSNLITISYDSGLNIDVNGQLQSLSGLERGDVIDVQVSSNSSNATSYWAQRIWLVRDSRN